VRALARQADDRPGDRTRDRLLSAVLAVGCGLGGVVAGPLLDAVARAVPLDEPVVPLRRRCRYDDHVLIYRGALVLHGIIRWLNDLGDTL